MTHTEKAIKFLHTWNTSTVSHSSTYFKTYQVSVDYLHTQHSAVFSYLTMDSDICHQQISVALHLLKNKSSGSFEKINQNKNSYQFMMPCNVQQRWLIWLLYFCHFPPDNMTKQVSTASHGGHRAALIIYKGLIGKYVISIVFFNN